MLAGHLRLEGGCVAGEDMSSSRARLLRRLTAPVPRFADDMLERSGELEVFLLVVWWGWTEDKQQTHLMLSQCATLYWQLAPDLKEGTEKTKSSWRGFAVRGQC